MCNHSPEDEKKRGKSFASIEAELSTIMSIPFDDMTEEDMEILGEYEKWLKGLEADKVDQFWGFIKEQEGRSVAIKEQVRFLQKKAGAIDRNIANLKAHYLQVMQAHNKTKVQGVAYTLSVRADKVVYTRDEDAIPEKFWRIKEERSVDKMAIKKALKKGEEVPGAELMESYSLQAR